MMEGFFFGTFDWGCLLLVCLLPPRKTKGFTFFFGIFTLFTFGDRKAAWVVLSLGVGGLVVLFGRWGGKADQSFEDFVVVFLITLLVGLPNEINGLMLAFSTFPFGLNVGFDGFVIPILFVSGKMMNGLLVGVGGSWFPACWNPCPSSGKSGRVKAATSQEGKRKLKLLLPRLGIVVWESGGLFNAGLMARGGFLCFGSRLPPSVGRLFSSSCSGLVSTWLLKKGGATTWNSI